MADGEMTIKLDADMARRVRAAAQVAGAEPDAYAKRLIDNALEPDHLAIAEARADEYDRTGKAIPIEEAFDKLRVMVAERRARRK